MTQTDGQEYSQSLNIDTEIKVPAKQKAVAKLQVYESLTVTNFEVEMTNFAQEKTSGINKTKSRRQIDIYCLDPKYRCHF